MAPHRAFTALAQDRSGVTALMTGLLLTLSLGFAATAIDLGAAYSAKRSAQNAADSAAFSAANGEMAGAANVSDQARAVAAQYGFADGTGGVTVAVNTPPASGGFTSNAQAVEVVVTRPQARFFAGFLAAGPGTVRGRAVAVAGVNGDACVLALDPVAAGAALDTGTANVNLMGCSLFANSSSSTALTMKGGSVMSAQSVGLVGAASIANNSSLTTVAGLKTGQAPMPDPYANVAIPAHAAGCNYNGSLPNHVTNSGAPVVICNGVSINAGQAVTLDPGVYIVDGGSFTLNGGGTLNGSGVTIILTGGATVSVNGGANVNITAPTTGPTAGLAFFGDRTASQANNKFNGGSTQAIQGAIYFPSQTVTFTGGSSSASGCTQLLAADVKFSGNATLQINCAGTGVKTIGGVTTKLVE